MLTLLLLLLFLWLVVIMLLMPDAVIIAFTLGNDC